ncbi:MAG: proline--tRNA ligase [Candidatus Hadarchaeales archaeon]
MPDRERWQRNFSEWFDETIWNAEIMDTRYPVKGLYVWLPYGLSLRNRIISIMRSLLEETGHKEVLFPLLIPEDLFRKEAEHIRGFEGQVYWVTHGGNDKLDVRLALRPTSETSIYPMFSLWIRSHADLPLKIYQVVNIFRYETKMTKPLIRLREVTTFKEAHTAHATAEDAERQVNEAVGIYRRFFDELGIPYVITRRPSWDKFAGSVYSIAFDTLCPDGRTLQIGTVHNLGQNFAKVYGLKYENLSGDHEFVHQTCYGISERVIAATIFVHGDDLGPCFPPNIAPYQVVIVPIPYKEKADPVNEAAEKVFKKLMEAGLRAHLDLRDIRPGRKFYDWDRHGVPLRIEIGPEDIKRRCVTAVRRDSGEHLSLPVEGLVEEVKRILEDICVSLRERARNLFSQRIAEAESVDEGRRLAEDGKIVRMPWCGDESCGMKIEEPSGGKVLGEEIGTRPEGKKCVACSNDAKCWVLIARSY